MSEGNKIVDRSEYKEKNKLFNDFLASYRADTDIISERALEYDNTDCDINVKESDKQKMTSDVEMKQVSFKENLNSKPPIYTEAKQGPRKTNILDLEKFVNQVLADNNIDLKFNLKMRTYEYNKNKSEMQPKSREPILYKDDHEPSAPPYEDKENDQYSKYYNKSEKCWKIPKKFAGFYIITEKAIENILINDKQASQECHEEIINNARYCDKELINLLMKKGKEYKGVLSMIKN